MPQAKRLTHVFASAIIASLLALTACCAVAAPLAPPPDEAQRNCHPDDIISKHYKLVYLDERPKRGEAAFYNEFPYHYLVFYPNRSYSFVATNHEVVSPIDLERKLLWPLKNKKTLQFTLDNKGELIMYFDKQVKYRFHCSEVTQTIGNFKAGDIILFGYTKRAKSKLYKLYRVWF